MEQVSAKELRNNFRKYLDRAEAGEEIVVLRRGKEVARIVPPQYSEDSDETSAGPSQREPKRFPDLTEFRKLTKLPGESPLESLLKLREETRY